MSPKNEPTELKLNQHTIKKKYLLNQINMKIIAKTFQGLEEVLAKELTSLGANDIEIGNRMVSFTGDKEMLYRANFCLSNAVIVMMRAMLS